MATPTKLLRVQHLDAVTLFEQIPTIVDPDQKRHAVRRLADELMAHMTIEERVFYPAALAVDATLVGQSLDDHAEAQQALRAVLAADPGEAAFDERFAMLRDLVVKHAEEEEKELFPEVETAWDLRTQSELLVDMSDLHRAAMEQGHESLLAEASGDDETTLRMRRTRGQASP
jgi:hemerythrin superfamily protein